MGKKPLISGTSQTHQAFAPTLCNPRDDPPSGQVNKDEMFNRASQTEPRHQGTWPNGNIWLFNIWLI